MLAARGRLRAGLLFLAKGNPTEQELTSPIALCPLLLTKLPVFCLQNLQASAKALPGSVGKPGMQIWVLGAGCRACVCEVLCWDPEALGCLQQWDQLLLLMASSPFSHFVTGTHPAAIRGLDSLEGWQENRKSKCVKAAASGHNLRVLLG